MPIITSVGRVIDYCPSGARRAQARYDKEDQAKSILLTYMELGTPESCPVCGQTMELVKEPKRGWQCSNDNPACKRANGERAHALTLKAKQKADTLPVRTDKPKHTEPEVIIVEDATGQVEPILRRCMDA